MQGRRQARCQWRRSIECELDDLPVRITNQKADDAQEIPHEAQYAVVRQFGLRGRQPVPDPHQDVVRQSPQLHHELLGREAFLVAGGHALAPLILLEGGLDAAALVIQVHVDATCRPATCGSSHQVVICVATSRTRSVAQSVACTAYPSPS